MLPVKDDLYYTHIFNGCYAGLMFVVVVFFLIYGVEVFFKVRMFRYRTSGK
jgi:von Hippel-Lindau disease tumor supressor